MVRLKLKSGRKYKLICLLLIVCASGCSSIEEFPVAMYEDDQCEECRMIISDAQFAVQVKTEKSGIVKFDDISCMLDYYKKNQLTSTSAPAYVVDYHSKEWISADKAYYVFSEEIHTPMHSGIIASISKEDAEKIPGNSRDDIYTFNVLLSKE